MRAIRPSGTKLDDIMDYTGRHGCSGGRFFFLISLGAVLVRVRRVNLGEV
jgi:hypothetical protein